jgi:DNA repair protein RadC
MRITDISPEQRPRERVLAGQGEGLSDAELLALVWGSSHKKGRNIVEMAQEILADTKGLPGLMSLGFVQLLGLKGLGPAKTCQLWAIQEIARRSTRSHEKKKILSPRDAGEYLMPKCMGWTEEHFGLIALNSKSEVIAERMLSKGTAIGTLITPKEFFREALSYGAFSALAYHNHPSGNPEPSPSDMALTKKLREAGASLGMELVDHIIVGSGKYYSFRAAQEWDKQ